MWSNKPHSEMFFIPAGKHWGRSQNSRCRITKTSRPAPTFLALVRARVRACTCVFGVRGVLCSCFALVSPASASSVRARTRALVQSLFYCACCQFHADTVCMNPFCESILRALPCHWNTLNQLWGLRSQSNADGTENAHKPPSLNLPSLVSERELAKRDSRVISMKLPRWVLMHGLLVRRLTSVRYLTCHKTNGNFFFLFTGEGFNGTQVHGALDLPWPDTASVWPQQS